jgi:hypothetical protein
MTNTTPLTAAFITKYLAKEAGQVLGVNAEPLNTGKFGQFPYTWQDTNNIDLINELAYDWVSNGMVEGKEVAELANVKFHTLAGQAINSITYKLSPEDAQIENDAAIKSQQQNAAFQNAWRSKFGSLPALTPSDVEAGFSITHKIFLVICTRWAIPATDLVRLKESSNIPRILNNAPPDAARIISALGTLLLALGSALRIANSRQAEMVHIQRAYTAIDEPTAENGGIVLNTKPPPPEDKKYKVMYQRSPIDATVANQLANDGSQIQLRMTVTRYDAQNASVSMEGQSRFYIPTSWLFGVRVNSNASYFQQSVLVESSTVSFEMTYPGLTVVEVAPKTYDNGRFWYYEWAISQAIKNQGSRLSGLQFNPRAPFDMSSNGPFGHVQKLLISRTPTVKMTISSASYKSHYEAFNSSSKVDATFMGFPLGSFAKGGGSDMALSINDDRRELTITLTPAIREIGTEPEDLRAPVLGATIHYPGASPRRTLALDNALEASLLFNDPFGRGSTAESESESD